MLSSSEQCSRFLGRVRSGSLSLLCAVLMPLAAAEAAVVGVSASSYTITFDSGFGQADVFGPAPVPAAPPAVTYDQVLGGGGNVARGRGGAGTFAFPFLAGIVFPVGTGVFQDWTNGAHAAATLRIDFSATYDVVGGFGPNTFSYANFLLGGQVSNGGFVSFTYGATFTGSNPAGAILGGALSGAYVNATPGAFLAPLFEVHQNGNFVAGNGTIDLQGFIEFAAFDGQNHDWSSIEFVRTSGIAPIPLPAMAPVFALLLGLLVLVAMRRRPD